jgi:hypothetical protein
VVALSSISFIRIEQQSAKIGINIQKGRMDIRQPQADVKMHTTPTTIEMNSPQGELRIDQSQAWDALGMGSPSTLMNRIYSESKQIALEGIGRIVENGNRMAAINHKTDAIADIAAEQAFEPIDMNYLGEASYDNVNIDYTAHKVETTVNPGAVDIQITANKPEITYTPSRVEIYMQQYPKIEMIPPQIDAKL